MARSGPEPRPRQLRRINLAAQEASSDLPAAPQKKGPRPARGRFARLSGPLPAPPRPRAPSIKLCHRNQTSPAPARGNATHLLPACQFRCCCCCCCCCWSAAAPAGCSPRSPPPPPLPGLCTTTGQGSSCTQKLLTLPSPTTPSSALRRRRGERLGASALPRVGPAGTGQPPVLAGWGDAGHAAAAVA